MKLNDISGKQWTKERATKLPAYPRALRVIKQQLWCCMEQEGIAIYRPDLHHQQTIACPGMGIANDVAQLADGNLMIAAENGLYRTDCTGKMFELLRNHTHLLSSVTNNINSR